MTSLPVCPFNPGLGLNGQTGKEVIGHQTDTGRWPANVATDGSEAVRDALPHTASGALLPHHNNNNHGVNSIFGFGGGGDCYADQGNAARFFYTGKPSPSEKEAGLDGELHANPLSDPASNFARQGRATTLEKGREPRRNTHATVKPIELMRWLIRLLAPPGGVVLDPFLGSGTTAIAAILEGRQWIGVEREAEYAAIAEARIAWWEAQYKTRPGRSVADILGERAPAKADEGQTDLFA